MRVCRAIVREYSRDTIKTECDAKKFTKSRLWSFRFRSFGQCSFYFFGIVYLPVEILIVFTCPNKGENIFQCNSQHTTIRAAMKWNLFLFCIHDARHCASRALADQQQSEISKIWTTTTKSHSFRWMFVSFWSEPKTCSAFFFVFLFL